MLPLRDDVRAERPAIVNGLLILGNLAVFAYMWFGLRHDELEEFVRAHAVVPMNVRSGLLHPSLLLRAPAPYLREVVLPLFTAMFLHGSVLHVVGNLWFLFVFGDNVEGRLGHARYLGFYLLCGVVAALLHVVAAAHSVSMGVEPSVALDQPMLGASGAIAGVLGAYAVLFPRARVVTMVPPLFFLFFEVPAVVFLGIWFVANYWSARHPPPSQFGVGVAYWAHVGGFVCGALLGLFARRRS
jgi:membrane associated rhomboid family serine protease